MTSVAALFYNPPGAYILFPRPVLTCCLSSPTLIENIKDRNKTNTAAAEGRVVPGKCDAPMLHALQSACSCCRDSLSYARGQLAAFSRDAGAEVGETAFWAGLFFLLPREQTMVSWNNAADQTLSKENKALTSWVLKAQSWANTLSCYNQASVNFHCRLKLRTRENLFGWGTLFFVLLWSDC